MKEGKLKAKRKKQQANKSKRMQGHGTKGGGEEEEFTRGVNRSEVNMMLQVFNKTAAWS